MKVQEAQVTRNPKKVREVQPTLSYDPIVIIPQENALTHIQRIYKFGTTSDYVMIALCTAGAIGAGVAMPLMFLILGRIVGNLTGYFTPGSNVTQGQFMHGIETNA